MRLHLVALVFLIGLPAFSADARTLKVSDNRRFLTFSDGQPFFWLGDTAWELFHRLNREDAEYYLENRRQKGFTVIQAVVLAELDGLNTPNPYGEKPLHGNDPRRPNERYFEHVDFIIRTAHEKGLFIALLPTWADKVNARRGNPNVIFDRENARVYGQWLGSRYRNQPNIVWVLGGDREAEGYEELWASMAEGLRAGDGGAHLKTFHPYGRRSSSEWLHEAQWLDFNMIQTGHSQRDNPSYEFIRMDYRRKPVKPVLDGEPRYENHPVDWKPAVFGWFDEYDARQAAYFALFAGAFGHTYGCHDVWQMLEPGRAPIGFARGQWKTSLDLPGAFQMGHVRRLMESRPMLDRIPDQGLAGVGFGGDSVHSTRGLDYAFVYSASGRRFTVEMGRIRGERVKAWWFDPRTGKATPAGEFANHGFQEFDPPGEPERGNDWVLILDDASRGYPPPGSLQPVPR
jgi:hypothetical protein